MTSRWTPEVGLPPWGSRGSFAHLVSQDKPYAAATPARLLFGVHGCSALGVMSNLIA